MKKAKGQKNSGKKNMHVDKRKFNRRPLGLEKHDSQFR